MFVMTVAIGFVAAEDLNVRILNIKDGTATVQKIKGKGKAAENDGEPVKMKLGKDAKIAKMKFNKEEKKIEAGEAVEKGLENELFTKIGEKGIAARITVEGEGDKARITQILVGGGKKKKDTN
jgi:hypothetical protein